jgi:hypothetical protein
MDCGSRLYERENWHTLRAQADAGRFNLGQEPDALQGGLGNPFIFARRAYPVYALLQFAASRQLTAACLE